MAAAANLRQPARLVRSVGQPFQPACSARVWVPSRASTTLRVQLWWGLAAILLACLAPAAAARSHGVQYQVSTRPGHAADDASLRTTSLFTAALRSSRRRLHGSIMAAAFLSQTELSENFSVPAATILKPREIPADDFAPYINVTWRIIGSGMLPITPTLQTAIQRSFESVYALFDFELDVRVKAAMSARITRTAAANSSVTSSSPPQVAQRRPPPRAAHRRLLQEVLNWNSTHTAQYQAVDATLLVGFTAQSSFICLNAQSRALQLAMLKDAMGTFGLQPAFVVTAVGTTGPYGRNSEIVSQRLPANFAMLKTSRYIVNFLFAGAGVAPVSVEVQTALLQFVVAATPNVFTSDITSVNETTDGTQANVTMATSMTEVAGNFSAQGYEQLLQSTLENHLVSRNLLGVTLRVIVLTQPSSSEFKVTPGLANETLTVLPLSSFGVNATYSGGGDGLPTGAIIAIVVAGVFGFVMLMAIIGYITVRRRLHGSGDGRDGGLGGFDRRLQGFCIPPEDIEICYHEDGTEWLLGEGAYGKVHKGLRGGVQDIAIKQLHRAEDGQLAKFVEEVGILKGLNYDKNIVQFYGACIQPGADAMLILEYMEGGDLCAAISADDTAKLRWYNQGHRIALDIARGLYFLHSHEVLHGDIKTKNVLLTSSLQAKIGDVGLASLADGSDNAGVLKWATFAYAAPEALLGEQCGLPADIYSFGVVLLEIVTGVMPRTRGKVPPPLVPEECPPEIWKLIQACTAFDPAARPTTKVCFNTLRVSVEASVAEGTITAPASQREYSASGTGHSGTGQSGTGQSGTGHSGTASSVPSNFLTGSGSHASALGDVLGRRPSAGIADSAVPASDTDTAPPAPTPPAAPSSGSSPGGGLPAGRAVRSSSCFSNAGAGHGHARLAGVTSDAAMVGGSNGGFGGSPLARHSGAPSDAGAWDAAAPAAGQTAAALLVDSRQSSASVDGASMYGVFEDVADGDGPAVPATRSRSGPTNPFAVMAAQRPRRSLDDRRAAVTAAAAGTGSGSRSRAERAQSLPANSRLLSAMDTGDSAMDRHGGGAAAAKSGGGTDAASLLETRTAQQRLQRLGSPMLETDSLFGKQAGGKAPAAGRSGLVDPSAPGNQQKLVGEAAGIQEAGSASEAPSSTAYASRHTTRMMSGRSQLPGRLPPAADHASAFWGPDGSVKHQAASDPDMYAHFLESNQGRPSTDSALGSSGAAAHQTAAAGGGMHASFDDFRQPSTAEPDLYAAFAE